MNLSKIEGRLKLRKTYQCLIGLAVSVLAVFTFGVVEVHADWLVNASRFHASVHGRITCLECHENTAAQKPHPDPARSNLPLRQRFRPEVCEDCHAGVLEDLERDIHGEAAVREKERYAYCLDCHDPHEQPLTAGAKKTGCDQCHTARKSLPAPDQGDEPCLICHLSGVAPFNKPAEGLTPWPKDREPTGPSLVHRQTRKPPEAFCRSCHNSGNRVGAPAHILPEMGLICLPCHTATTSVSDPISLASLILFSLGFLGLLSIWLSGTVGGVRDMGPAAKLTGIVAAALRAVFSFKCPAIIRSLFLDIIGQRRLWRQSKSRWLIHGLIFYPLVFRFIWGLLTVFLLRFTANWPGTWSMLDKNDPVTSFCFDLTGTMMVLGIILAAFRGILRPAESISGLPGQDWPALILLALAVFSGFIVEGMRIGLTGGPFGPDSAFLGHVLGAFWAGRSGLAENYGYLWYAHAGLVGAFIAYLPFSRMRHIVTAPLVMLANEASKKEERK